MAQHWSKKMSGFRPSGMADVGTIENVWPWPNGTADVGPVMATNPVDPSGSTLAQWNVWR